MRFLSVCSGIEAASVAWEPLGWRAAAFSEIEPFPCHVLAHRQRASRPMFMPDPADVAGIKEQRARKAALKAVHRLPDPSSDLVPNFGDLTRFKEWPDAAVDLLVGGTPCQSFSVAGLRKGLDDPRGNLALTYLAVVERYRPRWVVWENVPGVLSSNGGRDFGAFLGGLGQLGYGWAYRVLDAQFVRTRGLPRAVPKRRRRVFVVGHLGGWRGAAAVLFDRQSMRGDPPPRRETRQGAPAGTLRGTDGGSDVDHGRAGHLIPEVSNALAARDVKQPRAEDNVGIIPVAFAENSRGELRLQGGDGQIAPQLNTGGGKPGQGQPCIAFSAKDHGADAAEGVSPTLRAGGHTGSHANAGVMPAIAFDALAGGETGWAVGDIPGALHGGGKHGGRAAVATGLAVRRLTPLECERLQGFPDGYTQVPYRGRRAADGPRYKALGNSMAVNVMQWIGARIAFVEGILEAERGRDGVWAVK